MCGINGFSINHFIDDMYHRINNMNTSLLHRGPDAGNTLVFEKKGVALGHRRLSIIDVQPRSNQPMVSASGEWVIVFNGEIYNFQELKAKTHYPYKTSSDTEVILAYVEEYGFDAFLADYNGMFALCLYNIPKNYMLLARDRLGIKPLYYYHDENAFIFSSEIKGVLASGLVEASLFEAAIDEYLGNRYVRAPYTFFRNVFQLQPGHTLRWKCDAKGAAEIKKYWELPEKFNMDSGYDEVSILEEFSDELDKAISRRLISDVPLGTYLSGGVDSSLITAITAQKVNFQVNSYTIGFPELNEFSYAQKVAERYNTAHHEILIDQSRYFDTIREAISYKDAPLGVPNEVPLALMSKELKKNITVVLSGEGADELLGGYGRIYRSPFDYKNHMQGKGDFFDYFIDLYEYVPRPIRDSVISTDKSLRNIFDVNVKQMFSDHENEENIFRFFHSYHVQGLLQRVDTTTMLTSVEARVPFLDHRLIEYSYTKIPYNLKLHWKSKKSQTVAAEQFSLQYSEVEDVPKYLLKRLAYQYLPVEVIERKKVGFPVPLFNWHTQIDAMSREVLKDAKWIQPNALKNLIEGSKNNSRAEQILWMFMNVEVFHNMYFKKSWRY